jgi:DNA modification methylase
MKQSAIAAKIKNKPDANDIYYTPLSLVKIHLDKMKKYVKEGDHILDPFFGSGNYFNLYEEFLPNCHYDFTEIEMNKDFFLYNKKVDIIISNPPYSILNKIIEKCLELQPRVISLLLGVHNLTGRRIELLNNNGYFLDDIHFTKVSGWFGLSIIVTLTKGGKNCISFDKTVHKQNK